MAKIFEDILLDEDNDLQIKDGDLVVGDSLNQECELILEANQGDYKLDPLLGPNLVQMIKSNLSPEEIKRKIKLHLEMDNKKVNSIQLKDDYFNVDAENK